MLCFAGLASAHEEEIQKTANFQPIACCVQSTLLRVWGFMITSPARFEYYIPPRRSRC